MKSENEIKQLVTEAVQGSKDALEEIVRRIQQPVYYLSLRMLFNPEDAKDIAHFCATLLRTCARERIKGGNLHNLDRLFMAD
jgi:DNA-directed RNA polymerase specialized sigma24 family protein